MSNDTKTILTMKKIFALMMTAGLLSSCGIYSSYKRPEVKDANLYGEAVQSSDTSSIGDLSWKEIFTDPQLQQLIEKGLSSNTDLRIAHLKVAEASAYLTVSKLAYAPSLNLTPNGAITSYDGNKATQTYQLTGTASWEIDIFGKLTNAKRGAQAVLEQTEAYRQAVQTQLVATIANSYYSLLALDRQLAIADATLVNWEEYLRTLRALKDAGQATDAAVTQAEASYLGVKSQKLTLQQQQKNVENNLSTLLAESPRRIERGVLEGQVFPEHLAVGVPLSVVGNRPDVRRAEASLKQAFYATNKARSAFYPSITLSGTAGWTNNLGGMISNPGGVMLQAVGSLVQPIFNSGANRANLKVAKAQQEAALLTFQQSLLNAGSEVNSALVQWQTSREKLVYGQKQVDALQSTVKSTRLLMNHGNTSYLEVIMAQQSLLQAELAQVANRLGEIQGVISLYHALGGGLQ